MNSTNTIAHLRYEANRMWGLRRGLLCAELTVRHIPHRHGGDGVAILRDGLWFDVYPWLRQDDGTWEWVVDYPHGDPDDEHPGQEICRINGFRLRIGEILPSWELWTAS